MLYNILTCDTANNRRTCIAIFLALYNIDQKWKLFLYATFLRYNEIKRETLQFAIKIYYCKCTGWSESSPFAHINAFSFSTCSAKLLIINIHTLINIIWTYRLFNHLLINKYGYTACVTKFSLYMPYDPELSTWMETTFLVGQSCSIRMYRTNRLVLVFALYAPFQMTKAKWCIMSESIPYITEKKLLIIMGGSAGWSEFSRLY